MKCPKFLKNAAVASAMVASTLTPLAKADITAGDAHSITGPYDHGSLSVYLIHREGHGDAALSLEKAMKRGVIEIVETGSVAELVVRNAGDEPVFIQSGDIVMGGLQDRVLAVSMIVPPHSGDILLSVFCVEAGRWSARGLEDPGTFSMSSVRLPSKAAVVAMQGWSGYAMPPVSPDSGVTQDIGWDGVQTWFAGDAGAGGFAPEIAWQDTAGSPLDQLDVWQMVGDLQSSLSHAIEADVRDAKSVSSLQLTLENRELRSILADYERALGSLPDEHPDAVGYVFAVNGRIVGGDEFAGAGLFRSQWPRQLQAAATEAIAKGASVDHVPPQASEVDAFIRMALGSRSTSSPGSPGISVADSALLAEVPGLDGRWVHRTYLAQ